MKKRALPLSILMTGLALLPLSPACVASSSSSSANDGDAAGSSSHALGSTSSGGEEDSPEVDVGMPEAGVADAGIDVTTWDAGSDSGDAGLVDVHVPDEASVDAGTEGGADAATPMDAGEAGMDSGNVEAAAETGAPCVNLTVLNYEVWCSVTVNGGDAAVADAETVCVPPGTTQLAATALQFFELGPAPWHDTAGDMGQGDPGTVTGSGASAVDSTTVVVGATPKCVWVCCPFDDGSGCPTADQCP
jgi:hypothetical protein